MTLETQSYPRSILLDQMEPREPGPISVETGFVAGNRGPCGGVNMALETTHQTLLKVLDINSVLKKLGKPKVEVHTTNPIVHYDPIMSEFQRMGLRHTPDIKKITPNSLIVWSAHGHTPEDDRIAADLGCETIDTKCQLVLKPETIVKNAAKRGDHVVFLGGIQSDGTIHPEPRGIMGHAQEAYAAAGFDNRLSFIQRPEHIEDLDIPEGRRIEFISQTTFSVRETRETEEKASAKWGNRVIVRKGICLATDNRQDEVVDIAKKGGLDLFVVVGTLARSHNTKELAKCAEEYGIPVLGAEDDSQLKEEMFSPTSGIRRVALTSGASVPDSYGTIKVINWFHQRGTKIVYLEPLTDERTASFKKPVEDMNRVDLWLQQKIT